MIEAYPLCWPEGWNRTKYPECSRFRISQNIAQYELLHEIDLLGGINIILSTNIKLRQDGLPYASQKAPDDKGVAVYFDYFDKSMVFACDKYDRIRDNMQALNKTISAIRGIERWGASDMMERAFTGFKTLPNPDVSDWWNIIGVAKDSTQDVVEYSYKRLRSGYHPDKPGGDSFKFDLLQKAYEEYRSQL